MELDVDTTAEWVRQLCFCLTESSSSHGLVCSSHGLMYGSHDFPCTRGATQQGQ